MMIRPIWCNWILALALTACKQEDTPPPSPRGKIISSGRNTPTQLVSYAMEKTDTISVEGSPQVLRMKLVKAESPVPFLTYIPADMIAVDQKVNGTDCHFFVANFAGKRNDDAYLAFCILPPGVSEADAILKAQAFKASRAKPNVVTDVSLKNHNGLYYFIARNYPAEYGDGMGPRVQKILDEWRWLDVT